MNLRALRGAARGLVLGKRVPISVGFTITHKCNFLCAYCDSPLHKEYEMTLDEIQGMLDEFVAMGAARLGITGGEPLLKKELPEVVDHAHRLGMAVSVVTNGSLVPENLETLARFDHVILSLEGFEESHDALRGKGGPIAVKHVRNAYGDAMGVAALVTLLGIPFSLTMRRRPGEAASPEMVAAAAAVAT